MEKTLDQPIPARSFRVILSRAPDVETSCRAFETAVAAWLTTTGIPVLWVPSIVHLAEDDDVWRHWAGLTPPAGVVATWIHPRPARWILRRHGIDWPAPDTRFLNFAAFDTADAFCRQLRSILPEVASSTVESGSITQEWTTSCGDRWYPVIDGDRCRQCAQCLQFCLFDVYGRDADGRVSVVRPDQCKPGCPACSRVCPEGAIVFPLHTQDPAIAGAPGTRIAQDPDQAERMRASRRSVAANADDDDGLDDLIAALERLR